MKQKKKKSAIIKQADMIWADLMEENKKFLIENPNVKPDINPKDARQEIRTVLLNMAEKYFDIVDDTLS